MVLWYGGSCKEMCGAILWVGKQDDSTTLQSIYSMHRWPSLQRGRNAIRGRIVISMLTNCSKNVYTWHELDRPDILWSVNKLARSITKWTKACDKRLNRLNSKIHHTCEYRQYCYVGNTAKQCRLGLFQDSDFAGDLEDSKIHFWRNIVHFLKVIHLFQWVGCVRNKLQFRTVQQNQKSFPWMQDWDWTGFSALDLWDLIVSVLGNTIQTHDRPGATRCELWQRSRAKQAISKTRKREDRIESDISPVTVSTTFDERSGRPDVDQANKNSKNQ